MKVRLNIAAAKPRKRGWKDGDPDEFEIPDGATIIGGGFQGWGSMASFVIYTEKADR